MNLNKLIAGMLTAIAFATPMVAMADTNTQLVSLYQQLIGLLTQELALLKAQASQAPHSAPIAIDAPQGKAPYTALFTLGTLDGTEAVDFGDGHSTGSNGCTTNAGGYCDLKHEIVHTYQLPGTYTVTLYRHSPAQKDGYKVAQVTVTVQ